MRVSLNKTLKSWMEVNNGCLKGKEIPKICVYGVSVRTGLQSKPLMGLVDMESGEVLCGADFSYIGEFVDDVAVCVTKDNKLGYIKPNACCELIPCEDYSEVKTPVNGIYRIKTKNGWMLFSSVLNSFLVNYEFDKIEVVPYYLLPDSMAVFKVFSGDKVGLIRNDGIWIVSISMKDIKFIDYCMVVLTREDGTEYLLNVESNYVVLNNARMIKSVEDKVIAYISEFNISCLGILHERRCEEVISGYASYKFFDKNLIICEKFTDGERVGILDPEEERAFDIFDIKKREIVAMNVTDIRKVDDACDDYWYITIDGHASVLSFDGKIVIHCKADELSMLSPNMMRVKTNGLYGVYNLKADRWAVLPKYLSVDGPDEEGFFRVLTEIDIRNIFGGIKRKVWKYVDEVGIPLSREPFLTASSFSEGCAEVTTLEGRSFFLLTNGKLVEL